MLARPAGASSTSFWHGRSINAEKICLFAVNLSASRAESNQAKKKTQTRLGWILHPLNKQSRRKNYAQNSPIATKLCPSLASIIQFQFLGTGELSNRTNNPSYLCCTTTAAGKDHLQQRLSGARKYLLEGLGPVIAVDVPQIPSVLDLVVSDFLVLEPDNEIPELCFICGEEETWQE